VFPEGEEEEGDCIDLSTYSSIDMSVSLTQRPFYRVPDLIRFRLPCAQAYRGDLVARVECECLPVKVSA
jgi:hypothetical protein